MASQSSSCCREVEYIDETVREYLCDEGVEEEGRGVGILRFDWRVCLSLAAMKNARFWHRLSLKKNASKTSANSLLCASLDIARRVSPKVLVILGPLRVRLRGRRRRSAITVELGAGEVVVGGGWLLLLLSLLLLGDGERRRCPNGDSLTDRTFDSFDEKPDIFQTRGRRGRRRSKRKRWKCEEKKRNLLVPCQKKPAGPRSCVRLDQK